MPFKHFMLHSDIVQFYNYLGTHDHLLDCANLEMCRCQCENSDLSMKRCYISLH
uniref:Uncharacterized protein n=1 Tax=Arundo donax TaxID=35708 RepID=A0A0A9HMX2_ARUDO